MALRKSIGIFRDQGMRSLNRLEKFEERKRFDFTNYGSHNIGDDDG